MSYYPYFKECPPLTEVGLGYNFNNLFEIGYNYFTSFQKIFIRNYFVWVAVNSLIDLSVFAWFFHRYCKSMILPLIFFIAFNGMLLEFNLYRNVKAIDLFLLSVPSLIERKPLKYFCLNLLGITFHASAALYLPLYFIINRPMGKLGIWGGFILSNVIFLLNIRIIGTVINNISFIQGLETYDKLTGYNNTAEEYKISIGYLERTISFLIFSLLYYRITKKSHAYHLFYNCYWIYYCSFLVFYEVSVLVDRVPMLFMFSYWVLYPASIDCKNRYGQLIKTFTSVLVILKIMTGLNSPMIKYENLITGISSFEQRKEICDHLQEQ